MYKRKIKLNLNEKQKVEEFNLARYNNEKQRIVFANFDILDCTTIRLKNHI